jgi:hypothetical protein
MVAREGQQTGKLTKAFSKEAPPSANKEVVWGIFWAEA